MLTMEVAARVALGLHCLPPGGVLDMAQEDARRRALARAASALARLELLGLRCGVFGSALRPGDFLAGSDVDLVAWRDDGLPIDPEISRAARSCCHEALGAESFDLVMLPCANPRFQERLLGGWTRGREAVERASRGEPLGEALFFGPADVAFIDADRLDIASHAAERMGARARALPSQGPLTEPEALSIVAGAQTVARVAEKCAKDILREICPGMRELGAGGPFYPLLAYPCEALGAKSLATELSVALYLACLARGDAPNEPTVAWARETAAVCELFVRALRESLEPGLAAMALLPSREIA
jgi:hypothetical protein